MSFSASNKNAFIAESLSASERAVAGCFSVYRQHGLDTVLKRGYGFGRPSGLDSEIEAYLLKGLENTRWNTAEQARAELSLHFKRSFSYHQVWHWLKKCVGLFRVPRPVHEKRDSKKAEAFKRDFLDILRRQPISGKKPIKIWLADESRYGLLPNLRRVWTLKGRRPHKLWPTIERLDTVVGLHLKDWWEAPKKVISLFGKRWIRSSANAT